MFLTKEAVQMVLQSISSILGVYEVWCPHPTHFCKALLVTIELLAAPSIFFPAFS